MASHASTPASPIDAPVHLSLSPISTTRGDASPMANFSASPTPTQPFVHALAHRSGTAPTSDRVTISVARGIHSRPAVPPAAAIPDAHRYTYTPNDGGTFTVGQASSVSAGGGVVKAIYRVLQDLRSRFGSHGHSHSQSSADVASNAPSKLGRFLVALFLLLSLALLWDWRQGVGTIKRPLPVVQREEKQVERDAVQPLNREQQSARHESIQSIPPTASSTDDVSTRSTLLLKDTPYVHLAPEPLVCSIPLSQRKKCVWNRSTVDAAELFSFQAGLKLLPESNGLVVRVFYRDSCCTVDPLDSSTQPPLAYFRAYVTGAIQTVSHPLFSVGGNPPHTRTHVPTVSGWKSPPLVFPPAADEGRATQTIIPLSDSGHISVRVELLTFDATKEMVTRFYESHAPDTKPPEQGRWLIGQQEPSKKGQPASPPAKQALLQTVGGALSQSILIPLCDGMFSRSTDPFLRASMPWCGSQEAAQRHLEDLGFMTGRWRFIPKDKKQLTLDATAIDPSESIRHSRWYPHNCLLHATPGDIEAAKDAKVVDFTKLTGPDAELTTVQALEKHKWIHFVGDDRVAAAFHTLCSSAGDTSQLHKIPSSIAPSHFDPPQLCYGYSSGLAKKNEDRAAIRWVLTYENWFLGKELPLREFPAAIGSTSKDPSFLFSSACHSFDPSGGGKGHFTGGWPGCTLAPLSIQSLIGPSVTFFGFGRRHLTQIGYPQGNSGPGAAAKNDPARAMIKQVLEHSYFKRYATLFLLSPPVAEKRLLAPYYPMGNLALQKMNNARIYGFNTLLMDVVRELTATKLASHQALHSRSANGFGKDSLAWPPVVDLFSPFYAALDSLIPPPPAGHSPSPHNWESHPQASEVERQILTHYLAHCPNIEGPPKIPDPKTRKVEGKKISKQDKSQSKPNPKPSPATTPTSKSDPSNPSTHSPPTKPIPLSHADHRAKVLNDQRKSTEDAANRAAALKRSHGTQPGTNLPHPHTPVITHQEHRARVMAENAAKKKAAQQQKQR